MGVGTDGTKEVLGLWIEQTERAKFWLLVMNELKSRGHFPSDEAATRLIYLTLRSIEKKFKMPARTWQEALNQFAVLFEDRLSVNG